MLKKYECVMQEGIKDCGICSLLTIVKTYGGNVSKEYLRSLTNTTKDGVTALSLLEAGKDLGFSTKGVTGDVFDIDSNSLPCIAHVIINNSYKHFVVIHHIDKTKKVITIADPASGIIKIKYEDFKEISTDKYLLFMPNKPIPIFEKVNTLKELIIEFITTNKKIFISIFLFSLLYTLINIITAYNFQFIIESSINYFSKNNLYFIMVIMFILVVFKTIIDYFRSQLLNFINHKLDYTMVKSLFRHIISLPYLYYKNRTTGEVISRINDLSEIRQTLSQVFVTLFVDTILVTFVLIALFTINFVLSLITISIIVIYMLLIWIFNGYLAKNIVKITKDNAIVNSYMIESINSIESIKGLNIVDKINNEFNKKYSKYINNSYKFNYIYNIEIFIKELINSIGLLLIIFIGSIHVIDNKMSLAELITYNSLIIYFLEPVKSIINFDIIFRKTKIVFDRVMELYTVKAEKVIACEKYVDKKLNGDIEIKNLTFSYNHINNVIDKLNLTIKKGEKIIVSGSSGSGKSTRAKILMKYFDIERDKVFIDNKDINDYSLLNIRESICYISQNETLYTDSVYNNVVLSNNCNYDEFLKVSKVTLLEEIVKNNGLGFNMLLEENGSNLSGGEKERVVLSRSLMKNSDIYIMDETLSQVDTKKEREILTNLFNFYKEKTIIFISHRFDNEDLFDKCINLNEVLCE